MLILFEHISRETFVRHKKKIFFFLNFAMNLSFLHLFHIVAIQSTCWLNFIYLMCVKIIFFNLLQTKINSKFYTYCETISLIRHRIKSNNFSCVTKVHKLFSKDENTFLKAIK